MHGVRRFEDLVTWQRMFEMSVEVAKFADRPPASRDFKYRDQIKDASDSAQRNVAEGFARYEPAQFLVFLNTARASVAETRALLQKGIAVGYLSDAEYQRLDTLAIRGAQALAKLQRYLRTEAAKRNARHARYFRRTNLNDPNGPNGPNGSNDPNGSNGPNGPNGSNDPNGSNGPNDPNGSNDPNE
jgi:four helix bundle protein